MVVVVSIADDPQWKVHLHRGSYLYSESQASFCGAMTHCSQATFLQRVLVDEYENYLQVWHDYCRQPNLHLAIIVHRLRDRVDLLCELVNNETARMVQGLKTLPRRWRNSYLPEFRSEDYLLSVNPEDTDPEVHSEDFLSSDSSEDTDSELSSLYVLE
jgi:hypothetical protein